MANTRMPSGADWEIARRGSLASELIEGGEIKYIERETDGQHIPAEGMGVVSDSRI